MRRTTLDCLIKKAVKINPKAKRVLLAKKNQVDITLLIKGDVKSLVHAIMETQTYAILDNDAAFDLSAIARQYGDAQLSQDYQNYYLKTRALLRELGRTDLTDKMRLEHLLKIDYNHNKYLKAAAKIDELISKNAGKNPAGYQ